MGFYYGPSTPPPGSKEDKGKDKDKEPGGCLEALILTRAAFAALALPLGLLFGTILGLVLLIYAFSVSKLLGLLLIALLVGGIFAYARWERRKYPGEPRL